jgi:GDP-D-mannose dehydratase
MNLKEKAMRRDARERIIECLKDGFDGYYCDLHHEVFNTNYYIIGTERAKEALKEYDVFKAIEKVQTYEKENFDEIYTDLSDPENLIHMLFYIIGEETLYDMFSESETLKKGFEEGTRADKETNAEILKELGE